MNAEMKQSIDEFVVTRLNVAGSREPENLQEAFTLLRNAADQLSTALLSEQKPFLTECENAFARVDGELMQAYYRAGFSDAVSFLLAWRDYDGTML